MWLHGISHPSFMAILIIKPAYLDTIHVKLNDNFKRLSKKHSIFIQYSIDINIGFVFEN